jgi:rubrerythrin
VVASLITLGYSLGSMVTSYNYAKKIDKFYDKADNELEELRDKIYTKVQNDYTNGRFQKECEQCGYIHLMSNN